MHQSPSHPTFDWQPPVPSTSDNIQHRFSATSTYLLGQGRYATVYLASYKGKERQAPWQLCAAKRMSADRESQTLGLREAFFLQRLADTASTGSVYVVKLIAVKEDVERRSSLHNRSSSDALQEAPRSRALSRQRSSTLASDPSLASSPSLPALAQAARAATPSVSRLLLLLEHAPLGTMDRLLRTSPNLVGKKIWEQWAKQSVEALAWVHSKGVIHADVKPGNLLVRHGYLQVYLRQITRNLDLRLSDFGSSLLVHPAHPPTDGVGLGTLPFSPPELVTPSRPFSFPIDIFALGATLYQCLTGREPYRGCRSVEIMHHVRKGDLWEWEERIRIGRVGSEYLTGGSPYPSAWREVAGEGVKRGGSLRAPTSSASRPGLARMPSAESLRASHDVFEGNESPSGVKLWAAWARNSIAPGPIGALLCDDHGAHRDPDSADLAVSPQNPEAGDIDALAGEREGDGAVGYTAPVSYSDDTPVMLYLHGQEVVPEPVRDVLRDMVDPDPANRPMAGELVELWTQLGVGR